MSQPIFDAGVFVIMLLISFTCLFAYKKIGAVILVIPIISFLIAGLVIITGDDVAFYKYTNPINETITSTNGTMTTTTTFHIISGSNETQYLIGNGQFPIFGTGQLWMGWSLLALSVIIGVIFLDQTWKGKLILGD